MNTKMNTETCSICLESIDYDYQFDGDIDMYCEHHKFHNECIKLIIDYQYTTIKQYDKYCPSCVPGPYERLLEKKSIRTIALNLIELCGTCALCLEPIDNYDPDCAIPCEHHKFHAECEHLINAYQYTIPSRYRNTCPSCVPGPYERILENTSFRAIALKMADLDDEYMRSDNCNFYRKHPICHFCAKEIVNTKVCDFGLYHDCEHKLHPVCKERIMMKFFKDKPCLKCPLHPNSLANNDPSLEWTRPYHQLREIFPCESDCSDTNFCSVCLPEKYPGLWIPQYPFE